MIDMLIERLAEAQREVRANDAAALKARDVQSPYLNVGEAAAYCNVAVKTIYNRRSEIERLPGVGKLLFRKEALDKWLATRRKRR